MREPNSASLAALSAISWIGMSQDPYNKSSMKSRFSKKCVENKFEDGVTRIMKAIYGLKRIEEGTYRCCCSKVDFNFHFLLV